MHMFPPQQQHGVDVCGDHVPLAVMIPECPVCRQEGGCRTNIPSFRSARSSFSRIPQCIAILPLGSMNRERERLEMLL